MPSRFLGIFLLTLSILAVQPGCGRRPPSEDTGPLEVSVAKAVVKPVVDFLDFTGRLDAVNSVDVRARVSGYIVATPFKEGDPIEKGAIVFKIDPRPYKAKLDDAMAYLDLQKAKLKLAIADNLRARDRQDPGAMSKQDGGTRPLRRGPRWRQDADALTEIHKLNLTWRMDCSIDGRISRYYPTVGNLTTRTRPC
jgi:multidrug efflux pump subunit AcrA (membrane-fusion protein)